LILSLIFFLGWTRHEPVEKSEYFSFKAGSLPAPAMSLHGLREQAVASLEYKQQTSGTRNCA